MDYTTQGLAFRLKKALRYLRLYGIARTIVKIRGQYHMKRQLEIPPASTRPPGGHVGLLGCGNFAYSNIAYYLRKNHGRVLRAAMDVDPARAASLARDYRLAYATTDAEEVIADPAIDLVFIASNHASHAEYAIRCLQAGKAVHIEKPHVVNRDQLQRLCRTMRTTGGRVSLGFNRGVSPLTRRIQDALHEGTGPILMDWFIWGHEIPVGHWYNQPGEGGRVLGNLCHWTDFVYRMVSPGDRYPIQVIPLTAPDMESSLVVSFRFASGSIATISFATKGYSFEGVRERFTAQRGDALIALDDFQTLRIDRADRRQRFRLSWRTHGHEQSVERSYRMAQDPGFRPCTVEEVWETGDVFLGTRQAIDAGMPVTLVGFKPEVLEGS